MPETETVDLDIILWDGWRVSAAELNTTGWAKVYFQKGDEIRVGRMRPNPPQLELPEELGEYDEETELTLIKVIVSELTETIDAMQQACLYVMHDNIQDLLIEAAKDSNPKVALHLENVLKTLYEQNPEVLAYMALDDTYAVSIRAVPARLFGELARIELVRDAALLTRLLSHPEKVIRDATLMGVSD